MTDRERLMREYAPRLTWARSTEIAAVPPGTPITLPNGAGNAVDLLRDMVEDINERDERDDDAEEHTGVMVAFFLDREVAQAIALDPTAWGDCDDAEEAAEYGPPAETMLVPRAKKPAMNRHARHHAMPPKAMPKSAKAPKVNDGRKMDSNDAIQLDDGGEAVPTTANARPLGETDAGDFGKPQVEGVDVEEVDELHLTLAYLGDAGDISEAQLPALIAAVRGWAASHQPITGVISGVGFFNNADEKVTYASVDAPELPQARQNLVRALIDADLPVVQNHGFTPHVTLAYGDARGADVPRLPVVFNTVTVAYAGQRVDLPMAPTGEAGGSRPPQADSVFDRPDRADHAEQALAGAAREVVDGPSWSPVVTTMQGRTIVTGPATTELAAMWDAAPNPNRHMLWMQGRFVGAERPNRNGAFWSAADLEMGKPSVTHGPLNWLHQEQRIIGTIADAKYIPYPGGGGLQAVNAADEGMGGRPSCSDPHITALSAIWRWVYPDEASVVQMASDAGVLAYSMECISEAVQCVGDGGCGESYPYMEYARGQTCEHLQQRASVRRLVNPTFLGGAVIVPPTRPGWAEAQASVLKQVASMAEKAYDQAGRPDIPANVWEQMMAGVVTFAGRP